MNNYVMIPVVAQEPDMLQNVETETDIINQQKNVIYVPIASYDNYGIVKIGSGFSYENGVLNVGVGYSIRFTTSKVDYSVSDNVELDKASIEPSYGIQVGDFVESINENSYGVVSKIINVDENIVTLEYVYDKPDAVLYVAQNRTEEEKNFARQNINAARIKIDNVVVNELTFDSNPQIQINNKLDKFLGLSDSGKQLIVDEKGYISTKQIKQCSVIPKKISISSDAWTQLENASPYKWQARAHVYFDAEADIIELVNDKPIVFAKYGFAISKIYPTLGGGNPTYMLNIISIDLPNEEIILSVRGHVYGTD